MAEDIVEQLRAEADAVDGDNGRMLTGVRLREAASVIENYRNTLSVAEGEVTFWRTQARTALAVHHTEQSKDYTK